MPWHEVYGIAVANLGLAPSEVRKMTLGEIYAVMWAKTRDTEKEKQEESMKGLYDKFQEMQEQKRIEAEVDSNGV